MAHGAVLVARRAQIMKSRRHNAQNTGFYVGYIRVALQADQPDFLPDQHARVGRSVNLMATGAALKTYRRVLKGERAALVAVTLQTSGFVGCENLRHRGPDAAMRVVTIHATHRALRKFVMKRLLKLRPLRYMTGPALFIDCRRLANYHSEGSVGMYLVAGGAGHLVLGVAALQPSDVCRLIHMTAHADLVGSR